MSRHFIALLEQAEGCDCDVFKSGRDWINIEANSVREAKEILRGIILVTGKQTDDDDERKDNPDFFAPYLDYWKLDEVLLFEVSEKVEGVNVTAWYSDMEREASKKKRDGKEIRERKKYEKLRDKFG